MEENTRKVKVKIINEVDAKLLFVKYLKELTGLGLKDAKETFDNMYSDFRNKKTWVEHEIPVANYDEKLVRQLIDLGASFDILSDREWNLAEMLTIFSVKMLMSDYEFFVYEGSYEVEENKIIIDLDNGFSMNYRTFEKEDINGKQIILPFSECVVKINKES